MSSGSITLDNGPLHRRGAVRAKAVGGEGRDRRHSHQGLVGTGCNPPGGRVKPAGRRPQRVTVDGAAPRNAHYLSASHTPVSHPLTHRTPSPSPGSSRHLLSPTSSIGSLPTTPEPVFISSFNQDGYLPQAIKPRLSLQIPNAATPSQPVIVEMSPSPPSTSRHSRHLDLNDSDPDMQADTQGLGIEPFPTTSELQARPSIMLRRGYTVKRSSSTDSTESSEDRKDLEFFEYERVRERRMKMAEALLAKRKEARKKGKRRNMYLQEKEGEDVEEWGWDEKWLEGRERGRRFQDWERREALALANERKWQADIDRSKGFKEWQRDIQRRQVVDYLNRRQ